VAEVAERLKLAPSVAQRRLAFWIGHGVLADDGDGTVRVVETASVAGGVGGSGPAALLGADMEEDDGDGGGSSDEDTEEASVYILGMLANQGALSAEVIHSRLALFMQPYKQTLEQLHQVLMAMVAQEQLEFRDGLFRRLK